MKKGSPLRCRSGLWRSGKLRGDKPAVLRSTGVARRYGGERARDAPRRVISGAEMQRRIAILTLLAAVLVTAGPRNGQTDGIEAGLWRSIQTPTINGTTGPPRET